MLYILLSILIILPALIGVGSLVSKKLQLWDGLSADFILGLTSLGTIWTFLAFFTPINNIFEIVTLIIGWISFIWNKKHTALYHFIRNNAIPFCALTVIISFFGSFYPFILDHFGYYIPQIKWLTEFGIVKGLTNLELIQGQMSFWHVIQAGFSHYSDSFLRINTVLLVGYLLYIFEKKSYLHLIFFPILFLFIQSPSPDLAVIALSMILLNEIMLKNKNYAGLFVISVFIFVVKPTMIWPPLLVILYITIYYKEYKNFKWIILGLLIGIFYLFKNLWTFGYPIFPLTILDFNLPWKPHPYLMEFSARTAIEKTYDNQFTYEQIKEFKPWDYIYNWLFLKGIKSYIHIIFIASLVGFGIYTLLSKKKLIGVIFLSILIKSILVLLFSAQYRFFIDVFFVIAFIIFIDVLRKKTIYLLFLIGSIFVATPLSFPKLLQQTISSFKLGYFMAGFTPSQIIKPAFYGYKEYDTYQIGNLEFNIVKDYPFSFETPLPAITPEFIEHYSKAQIFPQKISDNVKDGFIWKKTTKEEQEKLDKILKNWKHSYDNRKK